MHAQHVLSKRRCVLLLEPDCIVPAFFSSRDDMLPGILRLAAVFILTAWFYLDDWRHIFLFHRSQDNLRDSRTSCATTTLDQLAGTCHKFIFLSGPLNGDESFNLVVIDSTVVTSSLLRVLSLCIMLLKTRHLEVLLP